MWSTKIITNKVRYVKSISDLCSRPTMVVRTNHQRSVIVGFNHHHIGAKQAQYMAQTVSKQSMVVSNNNLHATTLAADFISQVNENILPKY